MAVRVKTHTGKTIILDIDSSNEMLLSFSKQMEDGNIIADYNMQDDSTLQLVLSQKVAMQIFIETQMGMKFTLEVDGLAMIHDLKTKIQSKLGITPDQQRLIFAGKPLEDGRTIHDYNIKNDCTIWVVDCRQRKQIFVKTMMGQTFTLCVHSWDTILDVKVKIQGMEGTPTYLQRLLFDKYPDLDDSGTLADWNIKNGSVIRLIPSGKLITVKTLAGKTISFRTSRLITIRALKYQIQKVGGIQMNQYRLFIAGKHIEDENQTLQDYGISINEDWVIDLVPVLGGRQ